MQRTKTLTARFINSYEKGTILLYLLIVIAFVVFIYLKISSGTINEFLSTPITYGFIIPIGITYVYSFYKNFSRLKQVKYVEYDDTNLYVSHNDYQIQIPFEDIKEVNIVTGGFKFRLFKKIQIGNEVLCLPSLWYPFNYKKVDAEMNRVRGMIAKRKREVSNTPVESSNQLSGLNL